MHITTNIEDFTRKNHKTILKRIFLKGVKIKEEAEDITQTFYYRLIKDKTLEKFDEAAGASYDTYVLKNLDWAVRNSWRKKQVMQLRLPEVDPTSISNKQEKIEADIWEMVGENQGDFLIQKSFNGSSLLSLGLSEDIKKNLEEFKDYIKTLREKPKKKEQMVKYIELKEIGLKGNAIAENFGVSSTMVKDIKKEVRRTYEIWTKKRNHKYLYQFV